MGNSNNIRFRALIIDDQPIMQKIIRGLLREAGIDEISAAKNGCDAFDRLMDADERFPDVIICDLHMDGMSGTEFIHKIRRDKHVANPDVPVIVLTGESKNLVLDVARQVGANAVVQKPVSAKKLQSVIERVVGYQIEPGVSNATTLACAAG